MSPRSRSADSRQPQNNLILARNCLAITFIRDPNWPQLTTVSSPPTLPQSTTTSPCKRCSGLDYIDDNGSGESFDEKTISEDITASSSSSSSSHESSPFTSLSSASASSTSSPSNQSQSESNGNQIESTINGANHDDKTVCSSLLSDSSSSAVSSLSSSSPPCTCSTTNTGPSSETTTTAPPSSSIDFSGLELFTSFVQANYQCFWNPSLVSSVSSLNYRGFLLPATIIMIGSEYAYEVIRTAYARRIIRPPNGYLIQSLGDVPLVEMSLVGQTKFTPLTEALCKCINDVNQRSVNCFLGEIFDSIRSSYPNINPPTVDMIKKTLRSLQREGKVRFSASEGYFLVKPSASIGSEVSSSSVIIGCGVGGGGANGSATMEPVSPSSTIKRESTRLYSSLMTPDEVISRLHGSPTSSAESAYYGSINGGVTGGDTPTDSLDVTVNWDFGIDNQAMLLGGKEDGSDIISLRRSSSLRIPSAVKGINRIQGNGCGNGGDFDGSAKLVSNLSTTSSNTLTNGGPFSRSKSLRMVNHQKEKINNNKSMTIDSSETQSKNCAITVKKPSLLTKFLARLSYNGGGNGLTPTITNPTGPKPFKDHDSQQLNKRKLGGGCDWNDENNMLSPSQQSKSTQTTPVNNKSSSLAVIHRNRSNRCYCAANGSSKLSAINSGGLETQINNSALIKRSLTLDNNSRSIKCKPYGTNQTSCMYCETLRSISSKTKRSNHYNNQHNHSQLISSNIPCDLCDLITSPTIRQHQQQSNVVQSVPLTNYNGGYATIGSIVDPNCDKCLTSLTYCCTNIDCANITSSTGAVTSSSSRLYSSHYHQHNHHHSGHPHNHQQQRQQQPSSLLHQQNQPPINEQQSNHLHHHSISSSLLSKQSATLSSSSPPPSPYSRFTLSPTLRSSKSSGGSGSGGVGNTYFTSSRATPSSLVNSLSTPSSPSSPASPASPASTTSTINTNHHEKLSPITIQTNSSEMSERMTNGLSIKSPPLSTSQKNLITTVGSLTIGSKLDRSVVPVKVTPHESSSSSSSSTTTTTPSIITSTATKVEPITMKMTKDMTTDSLWNEIGGKQLEAELRETGITIGNSFNFKIQFNGSPTNQQQSTESTTTTSTSTTTKTLLSNGLVKSFTNFEEKSADNLPKQLPPLPSSKLINNQCVRPSLSLLLSPATNLTSVTNCSSTINVCTVNRIIDSPPSTNQESTSENITISRNANNKEPQSSGQLTINQPSNSSTESESIDNDNLQGTEMNVQPTTIAITTTTKVTNGSNNTPAKVDSSSSATTTDQQQTDSLTNGLIKTPTSISDIRQKVAQAKAAFFNSSSASAGETVKISSTC